jgi:RND family efflux transporter MFP subunit
MNPLPGRVAEIARAVDAASHAFLVKVELTPDARLRSGAFARVRFGGETRQALTVPETAILRAGQLPTMFVVTSDGRARRRVIRTGDADEGRIEVLAGLAPGERVILAPPPGLRDGDPVSANPPSASGTGGRR